MRPSKEGRRAARAARAKRPTRSPRIELVEPRLFLSADLLDWLAADYVVQSTLPDELEVSLVGVDALTGLDMVRAEYGLTGRGQTVVVIDTGIAYNHVALGGGLGAGYRVVGGYDFGDADADPNDDGAGGSHGTHVAGILASTDATHAGVAPGVDLVALKVFDTAGRGSFTLVEQALRWVHDHRDSFANPITTVNLSLGMDWNGQGTPNWATLEEELAQLESDGIFVAVAAGNRFTAYNAPGLAYPAVSAHVVPVASVDPGGSLSYFSQRDARVLAAPGRGITSTVPDRLGNRNGIDDDFAKYSGTSMAAPYVAGASVLLREAYELVGAERVTRADLYELMCQTADTVYDPITRQSYFRLNLARAVETILPADDFGSSAAAAAGLGTLVDTLSVKGLIGRLADQDWFSFTAGQSGTVSFAAHAAGELVASWLVGGGVTGQIKDGVLSLAVVAGRTYTVGLGTTAGLGQYVIDAQLESARQTVDWGRIDQAVFTDTRVGAAGAWFSLVASQSGILTVETLPGKAAGVQFQVYDAQEKLLGTSQGGRADVSVSAGQQIFVRATSSAATGGQVDFRLTNLVRQVGAAVSVRGTAGDDVFRFAAGKTHQIDVNGVSYAFDAAKVRSIQIDGLAGADRATVAGTAAGESAELYATAATLRGAAFQVDTVGIEHHLLQGGGGSDTVVFHDTAGNDTFVVTTTYAKLYGTGYYARAEGFRGVTARAGAGGHDTAYLRDTPGDDVLMATPTYATLAGGGFSFRVEAFEAVLAYALEGGRDAARLYDSAGNDALVLGGNVGRLLGQGFDLRAHYFEQLAIDARAGGRDTAQVLAAGPTSRVEAAAAVLRLLSESSTAELYGFERVRAQLTGGARRSIESAALDYVLELCG